MPRVTTKFGSAASVKEAQALFPQSTLVFTQGAPQTFLIKPFLVPTFD